MDPITVFGLLASIGQLIDLTSKMVAYVNTVKDAPKARAVLAMEASSLLALLSDLHSRAQQAAKEQDPWFLGLKYLGGQYGPIEQLKVAMDDLAGKFEHKSGGALRWPFTEKSIKDILTRIERLKSHISLALQGDHLYVTLRPWHCKQVLTPAALSSDLSRQICQRLLAMFSQLSLQCQL